MKWVIQYQCNTEARLLTTHSSTQRKEYSKQFQNGLLASRDTWQTISVTPTDKVSSTYSWASTSLSRIQRRFGIWRKTKILLGVRLVWECNKISIQGTIWFSLCQTSGGRGTSVAMKQHCRFTSLRTLRYASNRHRRKNSIHYRQPMNQGIASILKVV